MQLVLLLFLLLYIRRQRGAYLVLAVDALPTGEREVIALRYGFAGTPASTNEVAETLGVSRSTVRRREASALARLRERPDLLVAA